MVSLRTYGTPGPDPDRIPLDRIVRDVRRLTLRPGDVLVFETDAETILDIDDLRAHLRHWLPNIDPLILGRGTRVLVVRDDTGGGGDEQPMGR